MHLENCCFHSLCLCWGRLFVLFGFGFGFWGQFSSVSSHHFVWIVFTVAVEFRGMQIDFGEAGQLFKPASKLRALKSCTHTHTCKERERQRQILSWNASFSIFTYFPLQQQQQQLKNQPKLCTISWPVGVAECGGTLLCVWNCVDYDQSSAQVSGQPPRAGRWKREQTLIMGCLLHFLNCNWNLVWHWLWLWLAL